MDAVARGVGAASDSRVRAGPAVEPAELAAALTLAEAPRLGPVRVRALIDGLGSAREVLRRARRSDPILSAPVRRSLTSVRPVSEERVRRLLRRGIRVVAYGSGGYPPRLEHLCDPPVVLYLGGPLDLGVGRTEKVVAIVGTRRATPYGRRVAGEIASGLAESGWAIVSGMARGIDGAAHAAALDAGGATIGVLGSGLDYAYPAAHRPLYRRMLRDGLLVSEFTPSTRPRPGLFPRRNRIIAALAEAVVVVQAPARSGAMITVDHALDLGREVLAVPGPVGLRASEGTHRLLREGAAVATCAGDVLDQVSEYAAGMADEPPVRAAPPCAGAGEVFPMRLGTSARRIVERLSAGPANADELVQASARAVSTALALIGSLELEGILQRQRDGRYVLSSREQRAGPG